MTQMIRRILTWYENETGRYGNGAVGVRLGLIGMSIVVNFSIGRAVFA